MKVNWNFIYRKKKFDSVKLEQTQLSRVLNLFDLSTLGISCTLGSGIYVLAGTVIHDFAGPSVIVSFLIAGIASFFAGLCYAELGSRVPRSGSAYIYIYVTIGEFIAFIIGWDVILEYVIGTSSTASALSQYIDNLCGNKISMALNNSLHMNVPGLAPYPDFFASSLIVLITIMLIIGVKESSTLNSVFTLLNIAVILFIIIAGAIKANFNNWSLKPNDNTTFLDIFNQTKGCSAEPNGNSTINCGSGGFVPYGFDGIIRGSAKCFYAFIGFDAIATTGEEVRNAKRTIPLSIIITLIIVSLSYSSVSAVLTLMIPYYILDVNTPITQAFEYVGFSWAKYVVSIGAIASLASCLYASMFPMPRVVYSMATDGLIFRWLGWIAPQLKTPTAASLFTGFFAALMVLIFDLNQLIDMMSIGTLLAYALVSACTLVLRYRPFVYEEKKQKFRKKRSLISLLIGESDQPIMHRLFFPESKCNRATAHLVNAFGILAVLDILILCIILSQAQLNHIYIYVIIAVLVTVLILLSFVIWRQPQNNEITTFKIPLMPFLPLLSCFSNIYLMTTLSLATWLRFGIWLLIGFVVYFFYGIRNSKENMKNGRQNFIFPCLETSYKERLEGPESEQGPESTRF